MTQPARSVVAHHPVKNGTSTHGGGGGAAADTHLKHQVEELNMQLADMKIQIENLEKERDFYFGKLRDIEVICQGREEDEQNPLMKDVLAVLYATEDGFEAPIDEQIDDLNDLAVGDIQLDDPNEEY
jgi:RP/EB family microtubule-associated protein